MRLLVKGGRVIDPSSGVHGKLDVYCVDGKIAEIGPNLSAAADQTIDAEGCVVLPALVDLHAHTGEPGYEQRETLATLGQAAVQGGFGTVVLMPDTSPPRAHATEVRATLHQGASLPCRVHAAACLTIDREGVDPTEWGELASAGAVALGDCRPLADSSLVRRALTYLRDWNIPVLADCIDMSLAAGAAGRESFYGTVYGLRGMPSEAEEVALARDLVLTRLAEGRLHVQRITTKAAVDLIARAKDAGLAVTAEVSWLHLLKTDEALASYDTSLKVWPPLGTEEDRQALLDAVRSGVVDAIVSDHTPYTLEEKDVEFDQAPWGAAGIEHVLPALWSELVEPGILTPEVLVERLTSGPARAFGLDFGGIRAGQPADLAVLATNEPWAVTEDRTASLGSNHPYVGASLQARVRATVVAGQVRYASEEA